MSVRRCEAPGWESTLAGRRPGTRTCSPTCSNRVSARRSQHTLCHPGCARDPVLGPRQYLARGGGG